MPLIWPVMVHIALVFLLLLATGSRRYRSAASGEVKIPEVALSNTAWPDGVRKIANNLNNQFETPIMFYALCAIGIYIGQTGFLMQAFAWGFIASRLAHSAIHVTTNVVMYRFYAFLCGVVCLVAMWALILIRLLAAVG